MDLSQYPAPSHTLLHLSDTHLVAERRPLYGAIDSDANLATLLGRLRVADARFDAIVITGDLADAGAADAYVRLRELVEPFAEERGCPIAWVMGNHDDRGAFRAELLREADDGSPVDRVHDLNGLRLIALDSTVPGAHHGELDAAQLEWLARELAVPAEHGTLLALHHPPVPTTLPLLQLVELRETGAFEEVVRGTDVRGILAGHFHYSTHSTFGGVPVSVAAASCYTQDLAVPLGMTRAQDAGQGAAIVQVYPDRIVHSDLSLVGGPSVYEVTPEQIRTWAEAARAGERIDSGLLES